jgi:7,8-dihydro-6-hydroxymethylpterin-pyrophosphokinase
LYPLKNHGSKMSAEAIYIALGANLPEGGRTPQETLAVALEALAGEGVSVVPHPRATRRAFVLLPLQEIAPGWHDPVSGRSIADLVEALPRTDRDAMSKLQTVPQKAP